MGTGMLLDMQIGNRKFTFGAKTYLMGILNVTPDSFSDGGCFENIDAALFRAKEMVMEGADILDIGGESTHPGYKMVSAEEEIERIAPIVSAIKERIDIPVSVDTYKPEVAQAAAQAGADLINDIWGFRFEEIGAVNGDYQKKEMVNGISPMAITVAKSGLPVCLMHNKNSADYQDFASDIMSELGQSIAMAERAGIARDKLILDPGIGFGKDYRQNLWCICHLEEFSHFGLPMLLGASRKSVIGLTLDLPVTERLEGTLVTTVLAVIKGCAFVRVHDVRANKRAVQMAERILEAEL